MTCCGEAMLGRYIAKEIFSQFATTFVVINTIVFISQLLRLSEMLFRLGLTLENIILPVLFEVVSTAPVTVPTSLLFATMLALERLNRSGELTALLAAGYSLLRVLRGGLAGCLVVLRHNPSRGTLSRPVGATGVGQVFATQGI